MSLTEKIEEIFPLTPLQKGLLFHYLYDRDLGVYFEQLNCRLEGNVSVEAVRKAWQTLVDRHSVLRTAIVTKGQKEPVQVIFRNIAFKVKQEDWRGLSDETQVERLTQFLEADKRQGFMLNRPPLMRVTMIRLTDSAWQLIWSHHHIILDGWSWPLLLREFFIAYKAFNTGEKTCSLPPVRAYGDFLIWLKQKSSDDSKKQFWLQYLQGITHATPLGMLPTSQKRKIPDEAFAEIRYIISPTITLALQKLARDCHVTLNTVFQGVWAIILNRYSRNDDIVYGITVSGRPPELPGAAETIGPFINTLPLRVQVAADRSLSDWLVALNQQQASMRQFEHSSLSEIQGWSEVPRGEVLFESLLAFENFPVNKELKAKDFGLEVAELSFFERTHYPITLIVVPEDEGIELKLAYDTTRFDRKTMELLLEHLNNLLQNTIDGANAPLSSLSLFPPTVLEKSRRSVPSTHASTEKSPPGTLAAMFAESAQQYADRKAIAFGGQTISYAELDRKSNQVARWLQKQGIGPEKRVVVCLDRTPEQIIAILGIVKAGGVYVPVDPAYPPDRIEFTIADCDAELIFTDSNLVEGKHLSVSLYQQESDAPVSSAVKPENGAYIIYTSGSTGKPKGVLVTQHNVTRLFRSTQAWFNFNETDVWTYFHSIAFDFSVWEIWGALLYGGKLIVVPYAETRDPRGFLELVRESGVTVLNQTPSAFAQFLTAEEAKPLQPPLSLRYVIFGGEALNLQSLRPWFERHSQAGTRLINMYGITETTVHVTYRPISSEDLENKSGSVIGQPIPDLSLYVLDPHKNLLPTGVAGEIYVGGAGVARGYLNRPEQNAQRFIDDRFSGEGRLYRTGDLGRFLPNGDLEYLGRIDHQVKIRGFRIELGEIEAALSEVPEIKENLVLVVGEMEKRLVAYIVGTTKRPTVAMLRDRLGERLPSYMIPSQFVYLDSFPLTVNGKIDHKSLPVPEIDREDLGTVFVPTKTDTEVKLAQIWQKVLGIERVGRSDNYFVLGGDSIRSIRVSSLAEEAGLKLKFEQIFAHSVLAELAEAVDRNTVSDRTKDIGIVPFEMVSESDRLALAEIASDAYPLAQLQAGMLFYSDYSQEATTYNDVFSFRLRMPIDLDLFQKAYAQIIARHPVLRTAFYLAEYSQPLQAILFEVPAVVSFTDLTAYSEQEKDVQLKNSIEKERRLGFDWSKPPLLRFQISRLEPDIAQFTFTVHHAILDGWSLAYFISELTSLYLHLLGDRVPLPPAPPTLQYSQFVALEREAIASQQQRQFWQQQLTGIPFTRIPRWPKEAATGIEKSDILLDPQLSQELKKLAVELGVPLKTVLLAIHVRILSLYSGEDEIVTGLVSNGRPEVEGGDRVLGLFLNTVPLRVKLPSGNWIDLVREIFSAERDLYPNRRFPLAEIQRMHGNQPLFETSFNFVNFHVYEKLRQLRDIQLLGSESIDETNIPFSVSWSEDVIGDDIAFNLTYDRGEFHSEQAAEIARYYQATCAAAVANPAGSIWEIKSIGEQPGTGDGESFLLSEEWVQEIFERQVAGNPHQIAIISEGKSWTRQELNQNANRLAWFLRDLGIDANNPAVGICMERGLEMVSAILAVVKAGGCYVPIDPNYPPQRVAAMLDDAKIGILLTQSDVTIPEIEGMEVVYLDRQAAEIAKCSRENPNIPIADANQLAYIIFTSGSTGRPKGIAISHAALGNHMAWFLDSFAIKASDICLQKTPFSFDASVWEFWAPLMAGSLLVMAKPGGHQDPAYLVETIRAQKVTVIQVVPTLLEMLCQEPEFAECQSLRVVFSGGEALKTRLFDKLKSMLDIDLVNLYGPAEATIDASFHTCREQEKGDTIPIGKQVNNMRLYVLDRHMQPVPIGTPGELYIGGVQLAQGYWQAPGLTAASFLPDPFAVGGDRMYRTGDRARYLPDGTIEYLGRVDRQLKIRGQRVEAGEVMKIMETPSWVVSAALKAISTGGSQKLVGYVQPLAAPGNWKELLRQQLRNTLPDYMIPSLFVSIETWPLLPNGKIDYSALPAPDEEAAIQRSYVGPRDETETKLTQIWGEVLKLSQIGIEDNFFELGGDSILCLQIIAKARSVGINFTPLDLFTHPSITALAPWIQDSQKQQDSQGSSLPGVVPLTPIQTWFFEQNFASPDHWNWALWLDIKPEELSPDRLKTALTQIAEKHDAFRLRFRYTGGQWVQTLEADAKALAFDWVEITHVDRIKLSSNLETTANIFQTRLNLEKGPLLRAVYFETSKNSPDKLLLIVHHLIFDGISVGTILEELTAACTGEEPAPVYTASVGFAQWARYLDNISKQDSWMKDVQFWQQQQSDFLLPLDFSDAIEENKEKTVAQITCLVEEKYTNRLLVELPRTLKVSMQDVLLTVLLEVIIEWTGTAEMLVALENHGREIVELDILQTVGWFGSLFPLKLERKSDNILDNLATVKQKLQAVPHNGFSYGVLSQKPEVTIPKIPEKILFNYLGQMLLEVTDAPFTPAAEEVGASRFPENKRPFQLEVSCLVTEGDLQVRFIFSKALHREETIARLSDRFRVKLLELLAASTQTQKPRLADFPLAALNDDLQLSEVLGDRTDIEDIYPLSPVQEGFIFHAQYEIADSGVYVQQVIGDLSGPVNETVFQQAWQFACDRHSSLRASFVCLDLPRSLQRIHFPVTIPFASRDWSACGWEEITAKWQELLLEDRSQGFDLETPPLMRVTLIKLSANSWRFLWTHHHLLLDGWSLPIVFRDVILFYEAKIADRKLELPPAPVYRDFIAWLKNHDTSVAESFWRKELQGLSAATSLGLKLQKEGEYEIKETTIAPDSYNQLIAVANKNQVTLNTLVQAAWSIVLSRYSGNSDIVYGVTVSGRPLELSSVSEMVGLFINTLPFRVRLKPETRLKEWLQKIRDRQSALNQYSFSRLVDIQGWSDIPRGQQLFESIVVYENYPVDKESHLKGELTIGSVQSRERSHYPVTVYALPGRELKLSIAFGELIGDRQARENLLAQMVNVLEAIGREEADCIGEIGLLASENFNASGSQGLKSLLQTTLLDLLVSQVAQNPDGPAVIAGELSYSYEELDRKSNQVAHALQQMGVRSETIVGVCLERHAGLLIALLGILKAGGAYVPLDPSFPQNRLSYMLADSGASVIVTEASLAVPESSAKVLLLDAEATTVAQQPETTPEIAIKKESLAYVIYTSGSTGRPKGVEISHQALVNCLIYFQNLLELTSADTWAAITTLSFDISMLELFTPLISGSCVAIADRETVRDGFKLAKLLNKSQATVMQATPATWRLLLAADWQAKEGFRVLCGGEALPVELAGSLLNSGVSLWNVYGPTETTIWSAVKEIKQAEDALSIGGAIANTAIYILDSAGHLVPEGVVGEILIGGIGLARGYRGREALTSEKFIPHSFATQSGDRLYRTGDLGRFLANGEIEFLGRQDFQVKVRGFRIELGDVEAALEKHPDLAQVVVQAIAESSDSKVLVAYLVIKPDGVQPTAEALWSYLAEKLPDYMIPSAWVFLDAMPLTPNNKVDRRALPVPQAQGSTATYIAPQNDIERALAEIWRSLIKVEKVGIADNFFELGGHSLIAAQVHARIRKIFGIDISLRELFDALTIEKMAQLLLERESQKGRVEKIAKVFLRMKQMTPAEKAKLLEAKGKGSSGLS